VEDTEHLQAEREWNYIANLTLLTYLIDFDVVWDNPTHPGEIAKSGEDVSGEEVPDTANQVSVGLSTNLRDRLTTSI